MKDYAPKDYRRGISKEAGIAIMILALWVFLGALDATDPTIMPQEANKMGVTNGH